MKRKATFTLLTATAISLTFTAGAFADSGYDKPQRVTPKLVPVPDYDDGYDRGYYGNPQVEVWTRPGKGAVLYPGDEVDIYFRTDEDAYVVVYNIDTRGRARLLFPANPRNDGFVRAHRKISLPGRHAGYRLEVSGPPGTERIVALASDRPIVGQWRRFADEDLYGDAWSTRDGGTSWGAALKYGTDGLNVRLAAGKRRQLRPKLVPVPRYPVSRSETWFRVGRMSRWYR